MTNLINKVAESNLTNIDPSDFYRVGERVAFDLKPLLVEEFLLREKDFREFVKNHNWEQYREKFVAIYCSNDAIIPVWAFMLITNALEPFAAEIYFGTISELERHLFLKQLSAINLDDYRDKRVIIKGCGDTPVPISAYMELTRILKPVVKSIMYGEACSTVPVYKS